MQLQTVEIVNYRSVKRVSVDLSLPCRVLVGINESGKSNILNALSFLDEARVPVRKDDVRESLPDEDEIREAFVKFIFRLDKAEANEVFAEVSTKILASTGDPEIALVDGTSTSLKTFCNQRTDVRYSVDLILQSKRYLFLNVTEGVQIKDGWKKPSKACPDTFEVVYGEKPVLLSQYKLIRQADFPEIPDSYLESAKSQDLGLLVGYECAEVAKQYLPEALFWHYDEGNLLPAQVNIEAFAADPDSCVPLKNMFILADYKDIRKELDQARKLSNNGFQNFLDRVAARTTSHFRSVWKEYRNIEFRLRLDSDRIIPAIKEQNSYDFSKRSDGFKRFVTFLLMVSVNVKTDRLMNTLLLIDEPDSGLHPSGARYLRDELIRISSKNQVVYSTHSIFMIDPGNIDRHYIVKKTDEITTIEQARDSNVADEEVLFNALGFSMFEVLKEKNIIFEGWRDKKLFLCALEKARADMKRIFKDVGLCHAKGVSHIKTITPMIELAKRACVIVSDSDDAAKEQQKQYKKIRGFGEWKTYQDIKPSLQQVTGEDFVKNAFIAAQVNLAIAGFGVAVFKEADLPSCKGKLKAIAEWLGTNGLTDQQAKDAVAQTKELIFANLLHKHIEVEYTEFIEALSGTI